MRETEFKVLTYCGEYVDVNRLDQGIYITSIPPLYSKEETVESMVDRAEDIQDMIGHWNISEEYFKNLRQCKLVSVIIAERGTNV